MYSIQNSLVLWNHIDEQCATICVCVFRDRKVLRPFCIEFICLFLRQGDLGKLFKPIEPAGCLAVVIA